MGAASLLFDYHIKNHVHRCDTKDKKGGTRHAQQNRVAMSDMLSASLVRISTTPVGRQGQRDAICENATTIELQQRVRPSATILAHVPSTLVAPRNKKNATVVAKPMELHNFTRTACPVSVPSAFLDFSRLSIQLEKTCETLLVNTTTGKAKPPTTHK